MLKNYFKIALRNFERRKGYSIINISGLAIGIACCLLILLWVQDELSYDRYHENADSIYRVASDIVSTPYPLVTVLPDVSPEIKNTVRLTNYGRRLVRYRNKSFNEEGMLFADPSIFKIFTLPFVNGSPQTALSISHSVVLTESVAEKYFEDTDPVGKNIRIDNKFDLTVSGVIKDIPHNSSIKFDFLVPFSILAQEFGIDLFDWSWFGCFTYVHLQENANIADVSSKVADAIINSTQISKDKLHLDALTRIHLFEEGGKGDIKYVYIFSAVAGFILLIACINFMNLTTAKSSNRAREIGMRKVVGARRDDLITQFLSESIFLAFAALLLALVLVELSLPSFNQLAAKQLSMNFTGNPFILLGLTVITLLTGTISGSYPAFYLSSFTPVNALKVNLKAGVRSSSFRKILVVTQFSLSIMLIIGTLIVHSQLEFIQNVRLGYDREQIIYVPFKENFIPKVNAMKSELLQNPAITFVTTASTLPTNVQNLAGGIDWQGKKPEEVATWPFLSVDESFIETFKMSMELGKNFSGTVSKNATSFIINQEAAKVLGSGPIGKKFNFLGKGGEVIGVVKNFHFKSLRTKIEPIVLMVEPAFFRYLFIKSNTDDIPTTLHFLEETWNKLNPDFPFEYSFLDENYNSLYREEQRMGNIFNYFTFLAIFISCLGLFGLSAFLSEQRTKEVGFRKVVGASVSGLVVLLSKEYIRWIILSNVIAWPTAYYAMGLWLQGFAYRTDINLWLFALAGVVALLIALITVSYQALKVAKTNPVDTLRHL